MWVKHKSVQKATTQEMIAEDNMEGVRFVHCEDLRGLGQIQATLHAENNIAAAKAGHRELRGNTAGIPQRGITLGDIQGRASGAFPSFPENWKSVENN